MIDSLTLLVKSTPLLCKGALLTLKLLGCAACIGLSWGFTAGCFLCRRLWIPKVSPVLSGVVFLLRAVPVYVQILTVYFVLPDLLGINMDGFCAGVFALGLCSSSYVAEIVRAGIDAIDPEQWESCETLGYSKGQAVRYVIFPGMLRNSFPPLVNEIESLLKSTSILASIGLLDLTRIGMNIVSREMQPLTVYGAVAACYVVISLGIKALSGYGERRLYRACR